MHVSWKRMLLVRNRLCKHYGNEKALRSPLAPCAVCSDQETSTFFKKTDLWEKMLFVFCQTKTWIRPAGEVPWLRHRLQFQKCRLCFSALLSMMANRSLVILIKKELFLPP